MSLDIALQRTCYACPEQYDAINEAGETVGYLRLRSGYFTVQLGGPQGREIYHARPEGDGIFTDEERQGYLDAAVEAIRVALAAPHTAPIPPLETEQQASELPGVRAVYAAFGANPGPGKMTPHNLRMLLDAVGAAGVKVGAYDVRILEWLAGFEPATCAVVAGLITRAAEGAR